MSVVSLGPGLKEFYGSIVSEARLLARDKCQGFRCEVEREGAELYLRLLPGKVMHESSARKDT
jgi:hypothetical protein